MKLFTIGYSSYSLIDFIQVLKEHDILFVVDVRSSPYSRYFPEFNKDNLKDNLKKEQIRYLFLGENLGARINASECYNSEGKAQYDRIAQHPLFLNGIDRLKAGLKKYRIILMCAEKDPLNCHRNILVCKNMKSYDLSIYHILGDGKIEENSLSEQRLLSLHKLNHDDMFLSAEERLERAYCLQGDRNAYIDPEK